MCMRFFTVFSSWKVASLLFKLFVRWPNDCFSKSTSRKRNHDRMENRKIQKALKMFQTTHNTTSQKNHKTISHPKSCDIQRLPSKLYQPLLYRVEKPKKLTAKILHCHRFCFARLSFSTRLQLFRPILCNWPRKIIILLFFCDKLERAHFVCALVVIEPFDFPLWL